MSVSVTRAHDACRRDLPGSTTSAARLFAVAQSLGVDSTDHPQSDLAAHTRRPRHRQSSSPAPRPRKPQPAVRFSAVYPAVVLLSAQAVPPKSGCRDSAHRARASPRTMSSESPGLVWTECPARGTGSLHACPRVPSTPPAAAFSCPRARRIFCLFVARALLASRCRSGPLWWQH